MLFTLAQDIGALAAVRGVPEVQMMLCDALIIAFG